MKIFLIFRNFPAFTQLTLTRDPITRSETVHLDMIRIFVRRNFEANYIQNPEEHRQISVFLAIKGGGL